MIALWCKDRGDSVQHVPDCVLQQRFSGEQVPPALPKNIRKKHLIDEKVAFTPKVDFKPHRRRVLYPMICDIMLVSK